MGAEHPWREPADRALAAARQLRLKSLVDRASIFLFKSKPRPAEQRTQFPASSNRPLMLVKAFRC
ncbi:MAG: hypothetical protein WCP79_15555 [Bacillota bacterium]